MKKLTLLVGLISPLVCTAITLEPVNTGSAGRIAQITLNEHHDLLALNQLGEVWSVKKSLKLAEGFSPEFSIAAHYGRLAGTDRDGNFMQLTNHQLSHSDISLSPHSQLLMLPFATIAVIQKDRQAYLARIESLGTLQITATSSYPVLPDARPLLIDLDSREELGQIAVLSMPDRKTYQHAVLGDEFEAATLSYLDRHSLEAITSPLQQEGLVFEANSLISAEFNGKNRLLTVISGNGDGGRTVLIEKDGSNLTILAESEALPVNRWQSPFFFNGKIYTIQMPHLIGRLVELKVEKKRLIEKVLGSGFSNHAYGDYETNLVAATEKFAAIPHTDYRQISLLETSGNLTSIEQKLPAKIRYTKATTNTVYLLLENGELWQIRP